MSAERKPLGAMNPHPVNWFECQEIWAYAVENFLWPTQLRERERYSAHSVYLAWRLDLGARMDLFPMGAAYFERYPTAIDLIAEKAKEMGKEEMDVASDLGRLWDSRWRCMVNVSTEKDGSCSYAPANRKSGDGLRFCLMLLVLRYGVQDGSPPTDRKHKLVKWADAKDAAALLLALIVLDIFESESVFDVKVLPWNEVKKLAGELLNSRSENPFELKWHAQNEGIEGFRGRLRATMSEVGFKRVKTLALEFERIGSSALEKKWRGDLLLENWFRVGGG